MDGLKQQLLDLIQPIFDSANVYLVSLTLRGRPGSRVLDIRADTETGIGMDQIIALTKAVSIMMDEEDVIKGGYRIEISSPGAQSPLKQLWEFRKNIGRELKVEFLEDAETKKVKGVLSTVDEDRIVLKVGKNDVSVQLADINEARVQLKW
ncbi:MAG: ribosome maturation factor RimP [Calditrichia bacterium]